MGYRNVVEREARKQVKRDSIYVGLTQAIPQTAAYVEQRALGRQVTGLTVKKMGADNWLAILKVTFATDPVNPGTVGQPAGPADRVVFAGGVSLLDALSELERVLAEPEIPLRVDRYANGGEKPQDGAEPAKRGRRG